MKEVNYEINKEKEIVIFYDDYESIDVPFKMIAEVIEKFKKDD